MFKIRENLATHGLDWPDGEDLDQTFQRIDARVLREGDEPNPNPSEAYGQLIQLGRVFLDRGDNVVVCCSGGASRSNAIALGILMDYYKMDFYDALALIQDKVPLCCIEDIHIDALKKMFNVGLP